MKVLKLLRNRRVRFVLVFGLALAVPPGFHLFAYLDHRAGYDGFCGPHAPDIARHACTYDQYMGEFNAGFGGMALMFTEIGLGFLSLLFAGVLWMIIESWLRRRSPQGGSQGRR
jgi:hypothetical protein